MDRKNPHIFENESGIRGCETNRARGHHWHDHGPTLRLGPRHNSRDWQPEHTQIAPTSRAHSRMFSIATLSSMHVHAEALRCLVHRRRANHPHRTSGGSVLGKIKKSARPLFSCFCGPALPINTGRAYHVVPRLRQIERGARVNLGRDWPVAWKGEPRSTLAAGCHRSALDSLTQ
jgi:hypothetical protein